MLYVNIYHVRFYVLKGIVLMRFVLYYRYSFCVYCYKIQRWHLFESRLDLNALNNDLLCETGRFLLIFGDLRSFLLKFF